MTVPPPPADAPVPPEIERPNCLGCGAAPSNFDSEGNWDDHPPQPTNCPNCPPSLCESCGGLNVWSTGSLCSCWVSTEDMSLADLKALFADDCDGPGLSVERSTE